MKILEASNALNEGESLSGEWMGHAKVAFHAITESQLDVPDKIIKLVSGEIYSNETSDAKVTDFSIVDDDNHEFYHGAIAVIVAGAALVLSIAIWASISCCKCCHCCKKK